MPKITKTELKILRNFVVDKERVHAGIHITCEGQLVSCDQSSIVFRHDCGYPSLLGASKNASMAPGHGIGYFSPAAVDAALKAATPKSEIKISGVHGIMVDGVERASMIHHDTPFVRSWYPQDPEAAKIHKTQKIGIDCAYLAAMGKVKGVIWHLVRDDLPAGGAQFWVAWDKRQGVNWSVVIMGYHEVQK